METTFKKRYQVFSFYDDGTSGPGGGLADIICEGNTLSEVQAILLSDGKALANDWYYTFYWLDMLTRRISTDEENEEFLALYYERDAIVNPPAPRPPQDDNRLLYQNANFSPLFMSMIKEYKGFDFDYQRDPNLTPEENERQRYLRSCRVL